jgi:uncharacterized Zn finger protein
MGELILIFCDRCGKTRIQYLEFSRMTKKYYIFEVECLSCGKIFTVKKIKAR